MNTKEFLKKVSKKVSHLKGINTKFNHFYLNFIFVSA